MENPKYTAKYIEAISKVSEDPLIKDEIKVIHDAVLREHQASMAAHECGLSFEAKLYHKLVEKGYIKGNVV